VAWIFITLVTGVGTGMLYPSLTFAVQAAVPNKDQAYGVALFTFFRVKCTPLHSSKYRHPTNADAQAAGQAIGVAVGGTIFQNSMKREILKHPSIAARASEWSANSTALVEIIRAMPKVSTSLNIITHKSNLLDQL
jgi:hypothetical protein